MLIFNGKKYFVPVFTIPSGSDVSGADALPNQVIEGVKFVGKNGVVETGTMPIYDTTPALAGYEGTNDNGELVFMGNITNKPMVVEDEVYLRVPKSELPTGEIEEVEELPTKGSIRNNLLYLYRNKYYKRKETNVWVFNDVINVPEEAFDKDYHFSFSVVLQNGDVLAMDTMNVYYDTDLFISFYAEDGRSIEDAYEGKYGWGHERYKTITINEMPTDETFVAWLNENAKVIGDWEEYAETTANSDDGETWVFNSELTTINKPFENGFEDVKCSGYMLYDNIDEPFNFCFSTIRFYSDAVRLVNSDGVEICIYYIDNFLYHFRHATITFTELPTDETFIAWLNANATKQTTETETTTALAYTAKSVDELPSDAPDGSMALVYDNDSFIGAWRLNTLCENIEALEPIAEPDGYYEYYIDVNTINRDGIVYRYKYMYFSFNDGVAFDGVGVADDDEGLDATLFENSLYKSQGVELVVFETMPEEMVANFIRANATKAKLLYIRQNGEWVYCGNVNASVNDGNNGDVDTGGGGESENDSPSCLVVIINNSNDPFEVTTKRLVENNEVEDYTEAAYGYGEYSFFYDTQKGSVAILKTTLPCIVRDGDNYDIVYNNSEYVEVDEANQVTYVTIPRDSNTVEIVVG